jgi:hypothetical protein
MALALTPLDLTQLSAVVARAVGPNVPGPAKMMAAKGLVPMGPKDLVTVLYQLSLDPEARIAEGAKATAEGLPDSIASTALADALDARILHFFAERVLERPALMEKILLNRATHDETFIVLGGKLQEHELELLATNQERLLRCPAIIEALYFNKQTRMSTVERLVELAVRNGLTLARIPQFKEIAATLMGTAPTHKDAATVAAEDAAFAAAMKDGEDEGPVGEMELQEQESQEGMAALLRAPLREVTKMSLVKKIRLASVGTPLHRSLLIRDPNRTVAMAAINSDAVSEQEAARYAGNRALSEEVIREIAKRKEWQKNYMIKVSLVNNPKTPLSYSMHILPHLRANDVRALVRSKNIPSTLSQAAKESLRKKTGQH